MIKEKNGGNGMKVLLFNGSSHRAGCTYTALHEVEKQLHKHGIEKIGRAHV